MNAFSKIEVGLREAIDVVKAQPVDPTADGAIVFDVGDTFTFHANKSDAVMPCVDGPGLVKLGTSARFVMTERGWVRADTH